MGRLRQRYKALEILYKAQNWSWSGEGERHRTLERGCEVSERQNLSGLQAGGAVGIHS